MLRLDYLSCGLTIASTVLIGRRKWQGWLVAAANSAVVCVIGVRTAQTGFVPANLFCLAIYGYNIFQWRATAKKDASPRKDSPAKALSDTLIRQPGTVQGRKRMSPSAIRVTAGNDRFGRNSNR